MELCARQVAPAEWPDRVGARSDNKVQQVHGLPVIRCQEIPSGLTTSRGATAFTTERSGDAQNPSRSEWITKIQAALKKGRLKDLVEACKGVLAGREVIELRAGLSKPHRKTQNRIVEALKALGIPLIYGVCPHQSCA